MKHYENNEAMPEVAFAYHALGRRIEKVDVIAQTTRRYYYDEQRVAVQTLVSGGVETDDRYFVFGNTIDAVLVMGFRISTSWFNFYYGHDHLYSPAVLYGPTGTAVERYEYDAYGSVQILTANYDPRTTSVYANPYAFTGRERDALDNNSLHLMYYRARTYDPETGRFMQRDPLGIAPSCGKRNPFNAVGQYAEGANLYLYVKSNPTRHIDPFGLNTFNPNDDIYDVIGDILEKILGLLLETAYEELRKHFADSKGEIEIGAKLSDCKQGRVLKTKMSARLRAITKDVLFSPIDGFPGTDHYLANRDIIRRVETSVIHVKICRCPSYPGWRWGKLNSYSRDNEWEQRMKAAEEAIGDVGLIDILLPTYQFTFSYLEAKLDVFGPKRSDPVEDWMIGY